MNPFALLGAPYRPPRLHVGDRTSCLYRDCDVLITSWTDAPISWPKCRRLHRKGRPALLVNEELLRAIRTESALALGHWWGVGSLVVWQWRKAFGIERDGTPGSRQLILAAAEKGTEAVKVKEWTEEERALKSQLAMKLGYGDRLPHGYRGPL